MKKLVAVLLLALSSTAFANGYHNHHRHNHYRNNWVAPFIVGGAVTYVLTRPAYVAPPPPPVYYTQPYPAPQQVCTRIVIQDQYGNVQSEEIRCN